MTDKLGKNLVQRPRKFKMGNMAAVFDDKITILPVDYHDGQISLIIFISGQKVVKCEDKPCLFSLEQTQFS